MCDGFRSLIADLSGEVFKGSHFVVDVFEGVRKEQFAASEFSILAKYPRDQHLVDIELSKCDVWTFPVVSSPFDPGIVEAEVLDDQNLWISVLRS